MSTVKADADPKVNKYFDRAVQVLAVLVLPVLAWAVALQVNVMTVEGRVSQLEKDQASLTKRHDKDSERIRDIELSVVRMEGKLDNANQNLEEIKLLVRAR